MSDTTTLAKFEYRPTAPIGSAGGLKALFDYMSERGSIKDVIASHITPDRLFKLFLAAATRNKDILGCTQASIVETLTRAAELGLDISGTLGEAYPIPFNESVKDARGNWVKVPTLKLIVGYRGLAKLMRQSGEVKRIETAVVYENDEFIFEQGTEPMLRFRRLLHGDRGGVIGAYALIETMTGGVQMGYMDYDEIESVRNSARSKDSPAWINHWDEMARKTVFRREAKWVTLSPEKAAKFLKATQIDDEDYDFQKEPQRKPGTRGVAGLVERLDKEAEDPVMPEAEEPHFEPEPGYHGSLSDADLDEVQFGRSTGNVAPPRVPSTVDMETPAGFTPSSDRLAAQLQMLRQQQPPAHPDSPSAEPRKRGRPKGSKNKARENGDSVPDPIDLPF